MILKDFLIVPTIFKLHYYFEDVCTFLGVFRRLYLAPDLNSRNMSREQAQLFPTCHPPTLPLDINPPPRTSRYLFLWSSAQADTTIMGGVELEGWSWLLYSINLVVSWREPPQSGQQKRISKKKKKDIEL